jgi:hypothetical protein
MIRSMTGMNAGWMKDRNPGRSQPFKLIQGEIQMAVITASVTINEQPLKRIFVEHTGPFGLGTLGFDLTDANGSFSFDAGIFANEVDVKIHCQNSVIRVVDGAFLTTPIIFNAKVANGATVNVTSKPDHYRILNRCLDVYDTVWRQFRPFNRNDRGDFPLGKQGTFRQSFASNTRIELSYPDGFPSFFAFVEPSGLSNNGFPLAHIKHRSNDGRLFGEGDSFNPTHDPSLLPHEIGHVCHFSSLASSTRVQIEGGYVAFLAGQVATGGSLTHDINVQTSPLIAFIEAVGIFSERFFFFKKLIRPNLSGQDLRQAFFRDELSATPSLPGALIDSYKQVGVRNANGTITPQVTTGDDVEGAVYGAIYLDFASRVGLREAVGLVLDSNATTFDELRTSVHGGGNPQFTNAIDAVAQTWNL